MSVKRNVVREKDGRYKVGGGAKQEGKDDSGKMITLLVYLLQGNRKAPLVSNCYIIIIE